MTLNLFPLGNPGSHGERRWRKFRARLQFNEGHSVRTLVADQWSSNTILPSAGLPKRSASQHPLPKTTIRSPTRGRGGPMWNWPLERPSKHRKKQLGGDRESLCKKVCQLFHTGRCVKNHWSPIRPCLLQGTGEGGGFDPGPAEASQYLRGRKCSPCRKGNSSTWNPTESGRLPLIRPSLPSSRDSSKDTQPGATPCSRNGLFDSSLPFVSSFRNDLPTLPLEVLRTMAKHI